MTEQNKEFISAISAIVSQIDHQYTNARIGHDAHIASMQSSGDYVPSPDVTIIKDKAGKVSGVLYKNAFYNVKASLFAGYIALVKTEVPVHVQNDINALTSARNELVTLMTDYLRSRVIGVKKTRTSSGNTLEVKASQSKKDSVESSLKSIDPGCSVTFDEGRRFTVTLSNGIVKSYDIFGQSFLQSIADEV